MKVSDALSQRKSVRAFLDTPVENKLIQALLEKSARAASGGNLQPWRIFVINNDTMKVFLKHLSDWTEPGCHSGPFFRVLARPGPTG